MADHRLTKSAGEHWVCAALSRRGWAVALTPDGLERTDVLAVHVGGISRRTIEVQVKTLVARTSDPNWPLGAKAQQPAMSEHEWFALVALDPNLSVAPRTFLVPRDHVSAAAWISHMDWLTDPKVEAGRRNAGPDQARVRLSVFAAYEDRWDSLVEPTSASPVLLPARYRDLALDPRVGLPPGHPWHGNLPPWASTSDGA